MRLITRRGYDWTQRFKLIADAVANLRCRSCLIDGEAVASDDRGIPDFKLLIHKRQYVSAQLYAFDLLELDGEDMRNEPIERRKRALSRLLGQDRAGLLTSVDHHAQKYAMTYTELQHQQGAATTVACSKHDLGACSLAVAAAEYSGQ